MLSPVVDLWTDTNQTRALTSPAACTSVREESPYAEDDSHAGTNAVSDVNSPGTCRAPYTPTSTPQSARERWRKWLSTTLKVTKEKLDRFQARYNTNYDRRLHRQREEIKTGDHVFLRVERGDESKSFHKLAAVAEGLFPVDSVRGNTVVIIRPDNTVERVSRDRVTLAPAPATSEELLSRVRPWTDAELIPQAYPVETAVNLRDVFIHPRAACGARLPHATYTNGPTGNWGVPAEGLGGTKRLTNTVKGLPRVD